MNKCQVASGQTDHIGSDDHSNAFQIDQHCSVANQNRSWPWFWQLELWWWWWWWWMQVEEGKGRGEIKKRKMKKTYQGFNQRECSNTFLSSIKVSSIPYLPLPIYPFIYLSISIHSSPLSLKALPPSRSLTAGSIDLKSRYAIPSSATN
uniref:Uncharacterized protein n=1 Tax=Polytomella parva TaxID=51329 RepID=A0A7S0UPS0_9CHLO|mmetsp:Transcript_17053/g.31030  ORF Transcript_17053/g.31030 Transcript_17053/m.31030 type:complete len:149 (+) Transcript_17053:147-593(+)